MKSAHSILIAHSLYLLKFNHHLFLGGIGGIVFILWPQGLWEEQVELTRALNGVYLLNVCNDSRSSVLNVTCDEVVM